MKLRTNAGRLAAALAGTLLVLPTSPVTAAADAFVATEDTYTDASKPAANYGHRQYLRVDGSPVLNGYLKFQLEPGADGRVMLQLYAESASSVGLDVVRVTDNTWNEGTVTANNAPALGEFIASTGSFKADTWVAVDVSSYVDGAGTYSFGLTSTHGTAMKITSSEGSNKPTLLVSAPTAEGPIEVKRVGTTSTYEASSAVTGDVLFTGSLKSVVERATAELALYGGGTIQFGEGEFDLGSDWFEFYEVYNVAFAGAGMGATTLKNFNSSAADTEPFDFRGAYGVTVRDMTVQAGGAPRTTSDALDFDQGNNVLVENVAVTGSRGRGIVFDGKNNTWEAAANQVIGCRITGVPSDGIELLASTDNIVRGCEIKDVGGHGIQLAKSSLVADQPNKKSSRNRVEGNVIDESGQDGINVNGGDDNEFVGNTVMNSSDDTTSRDGIRIGSGDSASCDRNLVRANTSTDKQEVKTQRYGVHVASSLCVATVIENNALTGNRVGALRDAGTGTILIDQPY
jgi:parallel beta-helix repeat protein